MLKKLQLSKRKVKNGLKFYENVKISTSRQKFKKKNSLAGPWEIYWEAAYKVSEL